MQTIGISNEKSGFQSKRKIDALISMGAGNLVDNTLQKLISYQKARYRENITHIGHELEHFESVYNMPSDLFYKEFEAGRLGDAADYFEWSSFYENMLLFRKRLEELNALDNE